MSTVRLRLASCLLECWEQGENLHQKLKSKLKKEACVTLGAKNGEENTTMAPNIEDSILSGQQREGLRVRVLSLTVSRFEAGGVTIAR